jgi:hypothetical protein
VITAGWSKAGRLLPHPPRQASELDQAKIRAAILALTEGTAVLLEWLAVEVVRSGSE